MCGRVRPGYDPRPPPSHRKLPPPTGFFLAVLPISTFGARFDWDPWPCPHWGAQPSNACLCPILLARPCLLGHSSPCRPMVRMALTHRMRSAAGWRPRFTPTGVVAEVAAAPSRAGGSFGAWHVLGAPYSLFSCLAVVPLAVTVVVCTAIYLTVLVQSQSVYVLRSCVFVCSTASAALVHP